MSAVTLALTEDLWDELVGMLGAGVESAGVMMAGAAIGPASDLTLLGRTVAWVPDSAYVKRTFDELVISSAGWVPALAQAAASGNLAIFVHTHPGATPVPSIKDTAVDEALRSPFVVRTGQPLYAHLIVGGTVEVPAIDGVVIDGDGTRRPFRAVRAVGRRLGMVLAHRGADARPESAVFDRQVRAFGEAGQQVLHELRVGVVGAGGTGSSVIEQLIRLGVGHLVVIEPKTLTAGNVTRVYGSTMADVGRPKVDVIAEHIARIGLGTEVQTLQASVTEQSAAWALRHCDVVFGCTDDNAGRLVLSRLGYWYMMPVIDLGVVIDADGVEVRGIYGRITVAGPGAACLVCRGRIDHALARAEALDPVERLALAHEGYAPGLDDPDPSVLSFTTLTAAMAVSELLERLFGYGGPSAPTEQIIRLHARRIGVNTARTRPGCFCADGLALGAGDVEPFLDRTWT